MTAIASPPPYSPFNPPASSHSPASIPPIYSTEPSPAPSSVNSFNPNPNPPPYSLLRITPADQDSYHHHLLRQALRDVQASQDPSQWGRRQPASIARRRAFTAPAGEEEEGEEVGGVLGWIKWLISFVDPGIPQGTQAALHAGMMGPIGPFGMLM